MDKINWKQKLSSRKFWALVADLVVSVMAFCGCDGNTVTQITAVIAALGGVVAYVIAEAKVDTARISDTSDDT